MFKNFKSVCKSAGIGFVKWAWGAIFKIIITPLLKHVYLTYATTIVAVTYYYLLKLHEALSSMLAFNIMSLLVLISLCFAAEVLQRYQRLKKQINKPRLEFKNRYFKYFGCYFDKNKQRYCGHCFTDPNNPTKLMLTTPEQTGSRHIRGGGFDRGNSHICPTCGRKYHHLNESDMAQLESADFFNS
jgi:hypothetical protein